MKRLLFIIVIFGFVISPVVGQSNETPTNNSNAQGAINTEELQIILQAQTESCNEKIEKLKEAHKKEIRSLRSEIDRLKREMENILLESSSDGVNHSEKNATASDTPFTNEDDELSHSLFPETYEPKKALFINHCQKLFETYVDEKGNVDYAFLRRKRIELIQACRILEELHPAEYMSWSDSEKIAFWINTYNLFTLKLVVDNYPIEPKWYNKLIYPDNSIIQIAGAWDKHYFQVGTLQYNLREIEREILLEKFDEPRVFFAITYASMGGAFLRNEAFKAELLDQQLDDQVKLFVSDTRGFVLNASEGTLELSDIFNWYEKAFKSYESIKKFRQYKSQIQSYLNFIRPYIGLETAEKLESEQFEVKFIKYDWNLNEQRTKKP